MSDLAVPLLPGDPIFGLHAVAALAGIVVGWALNEISGRIRWNREQEVRWHSDRRDAYRTFLTFVVTSSESPVTLDKPGFDVAMGGVLLYANDVIGLAASRPLQRPYGRSA